MSLYCPPPTIEQTQALKIKAEGERENALPWDRGPDRILSPEPLGFIVGERERTDTTRHYATLPAKPGPGKGAALRSKGQRSLLES